MAAAVELAARRRARATRNAVMNDEKMRSRPL
jgi:hypothetical protein